MRTFIAFLVAPLLPAILPAWYMAQSPNRSVPSAYIFVCCLIYVLQVAVGIPTFLLFSRGGRHQLWRYLLLGFVTSAVPVVAAIVIMGDQKNNIAGTIFITGYFGVLGTFTALIFWLVARPDQKPITAKAQISN